jgi:hypothetical protein
MDDRVELVRSAAFRVLEAMSIAVFAASAAIAISALWIPALRSQLVGSIAFAACVLVGMAATLLARAVHRVHMPARQRLTPRFDIEGTKMVNRWLRAEPRVAKVTFASMIAAGLAVMALGSFTPGAAFGETANLGLGVAMLLSTMNVLQCRASGARKSA